MGAALRRHRARQYGHVGDGPARHLGAHEARETLGSSLPGQLSKIGPAGRAGDLSVDSTREAGNDIEQGLLAAG